MPGPCDADAELSLAMTWHNPSSRGGELLDSVLAAEGLDLGDPEAIRRGRDALTNAATWIWQQADWYWAVSPNSPVRFPVPGWTHIVVLSGNTGGDFNGILAVASTRDFRVRDFVAIAEGTPDESWSQVGSIQDGVSLSMRTIVFEQLGPEEHGSVRKVGPLIPDAVVRTAISTTEVATTIPVESTKGFAVGDLIFVHDAGFPNDPPPDGLLVKIGTIIGTVGGSFETVGTHLFSHNIGTSVTKVTEGRPSFNLRELDGDSASDFGRALSVSLNGFGPLVPMSHDDWSDQPHVPNARSLRAGDGYIIEGDPPQLKFAIRPAGIQTLVVHYLRAPTRVFGDDDVQMPYPFQALLKWSARVLLRKDGPPGSILSQEPDIVSEVNRLKTFNLSVDEPCGFRRPT